jgi:hypothetical protein
MIKILFNISDDRKLHFSWQMKKWSKEICNGLNIKEIDTQNVSNQDGFSSTK